MREDNSLPDYPLTTGKPSLSDALRESEDKYRLLFESIDEGFCIIEVLFEGDRAVDFVFLEVNPAFQRHTGIRDGLGRSITALAPGHEDYWFQIYGNVAITGQSVRFQKLARALNRFYDVFAFKVGSADERRVAVLFNDITRQKKTEEALVESEARLRESNRRKDEFLAMLGHELRNPLAAIRNATEVVKLIAPEDERLQSAQGVLDRQSKHMGGIVDGLLDVSRIARGVVRLEREVLDAREIVENALHDRRAQAQARSLLLTEGLPAQPVCINADRVRISQVLDNLLDNAIKFTRPGDGIFIGLREAEGCAEFCVRDSGVGMRPEEIERIFELFQQENQELSRSAGGLGLGLALAEGFVKLHGGTIEARSAGPGTGAEFLFRIPLAPAAVTQADQEDAEIPPRRVLIVEDNADAGVALRDLLELLGHKVELAESGKDALDFLTRRGADIVLCDLGLPGMSGYDVARAIRSTASLADTRLVAVTGYGRAEDKRKAQEAGFNDHLVKPVDLEKINEALRSA